MAREYRMYIDGEWSDAADGGFYDDLNPFTGEVFARVASGKRADAARAVAAAAAAFPAWSRTLPSERRRLFLKAGDILEQKRTKSWRFLRRRRAAPPVSPLSRRASPPGCCGKPPPRCTSPPGRSSLPTSPTPLT